MQIMRYPFVTVLYFFHAHRYFFLMKSTYEELKVKH